MVSTRLASPIASLGLTDSASRDRVDPVKLLDLIHRIKTASGDAPAPLMRPQPKPAKAG